MKKKTWFAVAIVLALCLSACVFLAPVRYRLYPGSRIRGTLAVTADGDVFPLTERNCRLPEKGRLQPENNGAARIILRGGDYGDYPVFVLLADGAELRLSCFQQNWWTVTTFDLHADVDTEAGTVRWTGKVSTIADNGRKITETIAENRGLKSADAGFVIGL